MNKKTITVLGSAFGSLLIMTGLIFYTGSLLKDRAMQVASKPEMTPSDWMAMQRTFPYGRINPQAYLDAVSQTVPMMKNRGHQGDPWTFTGPDNIGGRITDVESPPGHPEIIYVGAATGGVLKTTDNGLSWTNLFDDVPVISVGDIAIDPNHPDTIWCGTGEANSSSFSFLGNGIYRSTDAGETWEHMGLTHSAYIGRVIVDHSNSNRIFAAACGNLFTTSDERGIFRTIDGGLTWERVLFINDSTSAIDIIQHPTNPQILFAAMWERTRGLVYRHSFGESSGIWKSTDGGTTWTEVTGGLPTGSNVGRIGIDISRSDPDIMYAVYDLEYEDVAVYRSNNGGTDWVRTNDGILYNNNSTFGWYFGQIRVDPANSDRVYVMGVYLFRTDDGGSSWNETGGWDIHVDHHAMFLTSNNRILEGNDGGLYYSDDYGSSWTKINNLPLTQFYAIDIDNKLPARIYGGTQDNNTIRTLTGGTSDWEPILGGDGMYCLVDYSNSNVIYAEYQNGNLFRSDNGGYNMNYISGPMANDRVNWSAPLAMHPANPATLYFGTYRIWKTTNKGSSWQAVSGDLTHGFDNYFYTITTIDVSPVNPSIVVAGSGDGMVHVSVNDGQTWQNISAGLPERWITQVKADPFDANTIFVTVSGFRWDEPLPHVFKSTDLGQHWTDISGNLPEFPVNDIEIDPDLPGRIFVGTDAGLYGTDDGGQTWSWIWDGLPAVPVYCLKIHKPTRTIVAGTYGLSSYKASLDDIVTGLTSSDPVVKVAIKATPNPFADKLNLKFHLPEGDRITISAISLNGRIKKVLFDGDLSRGDHERMVDPGDMAPGLYIVEIRGSKLSGSIKVIRSL